LLDFAQGRLDILVLERAIEVDVEVDQLFTFHLLWWPRLDARHIDVVILENLHGVIEDTHLVFHRKQNGDAVITLPQSDLVLLASHRVTALPHAHHSPESTQRVR
jgi:hypothetical protein